ncbi:hypothetical protein Tco_1019207 [Tanacetum coccineum]|uniref:Tf2-1-like SH3-like domain-containing protein n=1 Tax=Tanacetum coccineum TaxID=301880 RepID=A0ABQ5FWJ9_9ASTR
MSITGVLGRGWGSPTDWSRIDPRNNRKYRLDQAENTSCSGSTKELRRLETKADGFRGWGQSYAQGLALKRGRTVRLELLQELSRVHHTFHVSNLNPRYVRPFKVLAKVGKVSYRLELLQELSRVHHTFHVSNLKKCYADEPLVMSLEGIQLR